MEELESIVGRLEGGGGSLEEALGDYSRAIDLMKLCGQRLANVERRVSVLSGVDAEGNPISEAFDEPQESEQEHDLEKKRARRSSRRSAQTKESGNELF